MLSALKNLEILLSLDLTYLELEHELDLRPEKFYKHRPRCHKITEIPHKAQQKQKKQIPPDRGT